MNIVFDYKGDVIGKIYIEAYNHKFPSGDWTDFQYNIISDWINVVIQNSKLKESTFRLFFMDGPYYLLCKKSNDSIRITGIDDHNETVIFTDYDNFHNLKKQLYKIAQEIIDFHCQKGEKVVDLTSLKNNMEELI